MAGSMNLVPKTLTYRGKSLPPSIPLVIHSNTQWNMEDELLEELQEDEEEDECQLDPGDAAAPLKVVEEALEVLSTIDKPIAVLSICGPFRTGKSYLLSQILGHPRAFEVGHHMSACTKGVWMGTTLLECAQYAILFLDTEGIDSPDGVDEAVINKMLIVSTLLSSLLVYNSLSVPDSGDLEYLSCFSQLSSSINTKSTAEYDNIPNSLPSFLWLIRDSLLQLPAGVEDPTEYLKKCVLRRSENLTPTSEDCIVSAIIRLFPSIECRTLPRPSVDPKIVTSMSENVDLLEPAFKEELSVLVDYIRKGLKVKSFADKQCSDGTILKESVEIFVKAVNSNGGLDLETTYFTAAETALFHFSQQLIAEYKKEMENSLEGKYPVEELSDDRSLETLQSIHVSVAASKVEKFEQKLDHLFPSTSDEEDCAVMDERRKMLMTSLKDGICKFSNSIEDGVSQSIPIEDGALLLFKKKNYIASKRQCQEVALKPFREFRFKQSLFTKDSDFEAAFSAVETAYYARAVGPAKADVFREEKGDLDSRIKTFAAQPTNLQAVGMGKDMIKLQWVETSHPGAIAYHEVQLTHATNAPRVLDEHFSNQNYAIVTKLKSNTEYMFWVRGISVSGSRSKLSEPCKSSTTSSGLGRGAAVLGWFALGFIASPAAGLATVPIGGPLSMLGGALAAPVVAVVAAKRAYTKHGPKGDLEAPPTTIEPCSDEVSPQNGESQDDESQPPPTENPSTEELQTPSLSGTINTAYLDIL